MLTDYTVIVINHFALFQQLRKLLLEIVHRIPTNDHLKPFVKNILALMFKLLEVRHSQWLYVVTRTFTSADHSKCTLHSQWLHVSTGTLTRADYSKSTLHNLWLYMR